MDKASNHPNSYKNFPEAVEAFERCKTHENTAQLYQDWVNWYGEESAMQMCVIMRAESDFRETVVGKNNDGSYDVGLLQINAYWHCPKIGMVKNSAACIEELKKPEVNISIARQLYEASGWTPWYGRLAYLPAFHADRLTI